MKIPQHILEAINCGEETAEKYYSVYGKEELDKALAELKKSDEEILAAYPAGRIYAVANTRRRFVSAKWAGLGLATAAALLIAFSPAVTTARAKTPTAAAPVTDSPNRLKGTANDGEPQLYIYRKDGQDAELLRNKSKAKAGDQLQVAFNANGKPFVLIFSVDGNGNVTNHFPSNNLRSKLVEPNSGTLFLDFSYELDDAPSFESFVIITSENPFDLEAQKNNIAKMSRKELTDGSFVPENASFTVFTLKK